MNDVLERVGEDISNTPLLDTNTLMPILACDVATPSTLCDALERIDQDISDTQLPIPTVDVATPPLLSMSTVETNNVYESLLETNTSVYSSVPSCETSSSSRSRRRDQFRIDQCTNRERFDMEYKLRTWRLTNSKSFPSSSLLFPSRKSEPERKFHSAPPSPSRRADRSEPGERIVDHTTQSTFLDTPRSSSLHSPSVLSSTSFKGIDHQPDSDATRKILDFLASKVDLLSVSINTIQYNLTKIAETLHISLEEKIRETDKKLTISIETKLDYLENKFDSFKTKTDKQFKEMKSENLELWDKLEAYILSEAEREDCIKECFNNSSHHPCTADLIPLKEELEKKVAELDARLAAPQPSTRLGSFSEDCWEVPPADNAERGDIDDDRIVGIDGIVNPTANLESLHYVVTDKFDQMAKFMNEWETKITDLDVRIIECEQYSRRECLVINGIPASVKDDQLDATVISILSKLQIYISGKDISAIHRLGVTKDIRYPARVIVKFINRKILDMCHERNEWLPDLQQELKMNIRFHESLAQRNQESLRLCKWLKSNGKIHDHFLRNGYSKIVVAENEKPIKVPHPLFLRDKFDIPEGVK